MIYIEVLELHFCGFDYELKKKIEIRGKEDIRDIIDDLNLITNDNEPDNKSSSDISSQKSGK